MSRDSSIIGRRVLRVGGRNRSDTLHVVGMEGIIHRLAGWPVPDAQKSAESTQTFIIINMAYVGLRLAMLNVQRNPIVHQDLYSKKCWPMFVDSIAYIGMYRYTIPH